MGWLQRLKLGPVGGPNPTPSAGAPCHGLAVGDPGPSAPLDFAQNALRAKSRDLVGRTAWAAAGVESYVANARGMGSDPILVSILVSW